MKIELSAKEKEIINYVAKTNHVGSKFLLEQILLIGFIYLVQDVEEERDNNILNKHDWPYVCGLTFDELFSDYDTSIQELDSKYKMKKHHDCNLVKTYAPGYIQTNL